jgi:FtsZ-binding cell division protein ZapB
MSRKGQSYRHYTAEERGQVMEKVAEGMLRKDIAALFDIPQGTIDHWAHREKHETATRVMDLTSTPESISPFDYPRPNIDRFSTEASFVQAFVDRVTEFHYQVQHFRETTMKLTQEKVQAIEERDSARAENKKLMVRLNDVVYRQANWKDQIAAVGKSLNDA